MNASQIDKRIRVYLKADKRSLDHLGLTKKPVINFPGRIRITLLAKFAMWILRIQGGILDTEFRLKK